jgi:uncharacterized RDD family membrane protein YckC
MNTGDDKGDLLRDLQAQLERRFYAAMIDMLVVSVGCYGVVQADGVLLPGRVRGALGPALLMMSALIALEALTGRSLGKRMLGLRIERTEGGRATVAQTVMRAIVRWIAPLISLASVLTKDSITASLLLGGAMIVVICEVPACYIALFRTGGTIFDLAAGTRVVARVER